MEDIEREYLMDRIYLIEAQEELEQSFYIPEYGEVILENIDEEYILDRILS
jgi:hypothetical protein